jgi:hypothetical protein
MKGSAPATFSKKKKLGQGCPKYDIYFGERRAEELLIHRDQSENILTFAVQCKYKKLRGLTS